MNILKVLALLMGFILAGIVLFTALGWVVQSDFRLKAFVALMLTGILIMAAVGVCTGSGWCQW